MTNTTINAAWIKNEWQSRLLDYLATEESCTASQLACYATTQVRKLCREHNVDERDVMTTSSSYRDPQLEISTSTVNAFLAKRGDVVCLGKGYWAGRESKVWDTKANIERRKQEAAQKAETNAAITSRVLVQRNYNRWTVLLDWNVAAEFTCDDPSVPSPLDAKEEAEGFARRLRIALVKATMP